jgi:ribonucleoside-diphosphate reductase alpha chain
MNIFDEACKTVSSAGGRRGAQMATFDINHPDVFDFIRAKQEDGVLRQFNMSLLITEAFMEAVKSDDKWVLSFPVSLNEVEAEQLDVNDPEQFVWREFPIHDGYVVNGDGFVACRIYRTVPARDIWNAVMTSTYDYAEPGFILIDKVNQMNNNWFCEDIRSTNPCGEQPLPAYGSCLLGSINLTQFVKDPFTEQASFDWARYRKVVGIFTRMLDNVVEINGLPLGQQREEIETKRRHGMGILGLGSALSMMGMKYGSEGSQDFTEQTTKELAVEGWKQALALAEEKGAAPILEQEFEVTGEMLRKRPEMTRDGYQPGDKVLGKVLHARYSRYMQQIAKFNPGLVEALAVTGARFTHHSSIAPTGTISLSLANNSSNGIEPSFSLHYARNIIKQGRKTKEKVDVFSYELLRYRHDINAEAMPYSQDPDKAIPEYFSTAEEVTPE